MNSIRTQLKRLCSTLLVFVLVLGCFPVYASAAFDSSAGLYVNHKVEFTDTDTKIDRMDPADGQSLTPEGNNMTPQWSASEETINLYVTSASMTEEEKNICAVPHVVGADGNIYYLQRVMWADRSGLYGLKNREEILSAAVIKQAAVDENKDAYNFDPSTITAEPQNSSGTKKYYIWYVWTTTPPNKWDVGTVERTTYTVDYDVELPEELAEDDLVIYPAIEQNGVKSYVLGDSGLGGLTALKKEIDNYDTTAKDGLNFAVAANSSVVNIDYLIFNHDLSVCYDFDGWIDESGVKHDRGDTLKASSALAGGDTTITLKAAWSKIDNLSDTANVPEDFGLFNEPATQILQWTNAVQTPTAKDVTLDETGTINYQITAKMDPTIAGQLNSYYLGEGFFQFDIAVDVDDNLVLAGSTGESVTLTFNCGFLKPSKLTVGTKEVAITTDGTGSISVSASSILNEDGSIKDFTLTATVVPDTYQQAVLNSGLSLTLPALKLKTDACGTPVSKGAVQTTTTVSGAINFDASYNYRAAMQLANSHLYNEEAWRSCFEGDSGNPTALIHAAQFIRSTLGSFSDSALNSAAKATYTAYTITATAGTGGTITPGTTQVYKGDSQTFTITPNEGFEIADITVDGEKVNVVPGENGTATYTFEDVIADHTISVTFKSTTAVTFTPANIIVYMGGTRYEGAVDENGTVISNVNAGLPEPGFRVDLPAGLEGTDLATLTFKETGGGNRTWKLTPYDGESKDIYKLVPTDSTSPTRMQFTKADGTVIPSDEFEVGREVNTSFGMKLYHDDNTGTISVEINGVTYPVESTPGTLYVRGTTDDVIISSVGTTAPANGQPGAVADPNTTYTINDSDVQVVGGNVSLLFDEIINNQGDDRTGQLKARAERELPQLSGNRDYAYEFKYLDLVDASNGNTWVKASDNLTIYWPLPEGADVDTLKVLHFEGLHRNMQSGTIEDSIANCKVETISCQVSGDYVTFDIGSGGFSPFALVWEERGPIVPPTTYYTITATAGEGGAIAPDGTVRVTQGADRTFTISAAEGYVIADVLVDGESIGAVDRYTFENVRQNHTIEARFQPVSNVADPDDTGVSDWLNTDDHLAYLDGYPDNTFQPEEDMTRAEAAQMFYNLLRDQDVDTTVSFTDVAADAWYAEAVNTLATLEIVDGVGDNRFAPERTITRAEFTTMAMRFCQEIPTGENIFSDVDQDDWFYDYVVGSIQYGWINGYPDGTFRPNDTITRAEVTTIANRMLGRAADEAYVDGHQDQLRAFPDVTKGYWAYYDITEATNAHTYTQDSQGEDWTGLA